MKIIGFISRHRFLVAFVAVLLLALVFEHNIRLKPSENKEFSYVQNVIAKKTHKVDQLLKDIEQKLDSTSLEQLMYQFDFISKDLSRDEGIVILGYSSDSLVFWSDNSVPVENFKIDNQLYSDVAKLKNGWFIVRRNHVNGHELFGLILIKHEYSYQNEFVQSDFFYQYDIDIPVSIDVDQSKGYPITDYLGKYLFSFEIESNFIYHKANVLLASVFYLVAILFLFLFIRKLFEALNSEKLKVFFLLLVAVFLVFLRYIMLEYNFPAVFKQLELFKPHYFAISSWVPSLGDLLLHAIFIFFFFTLFYIEFTLSFPKKRSIKYVFLGLSVIITFVFFGFIHYFFESIILHSSIAFNVYQFFSLSVYSVIGFIIIALLLASQFFFIDRLLRIMKSNMRFKDFIIAFIPLLLILSIVVNLFSFQLKIFSLVFYGFLFIYLAYVRLVKRSYTYPVTIILLLILALYTVGFITVISAQKEQETKKVLALNLANERDQIAEMLLEGLEKEIENDTIVRDLLTWHLQNEGAIKEHLQMNYFSGYFRKYDLQISTCNPYDDLTILLENSTEIVHCYSFFNDLFENEGVKLQNSRFYFLENEGGRIRYLGRFIFKKKEWKNEVSLFVYIDSKLVSQELGYPELLLDSKMNGSSVLNDYSYAKYRDGDLITRSGEFSYQLTIPESWKSEQEFFFTNDNRYDHLIYTFDESTQIVITNKKVRFIDVLASFSYIFVFYYILYTMVVFGMRFPHNLREFNYDFKNKIKFSMIGVLLLSLIIVGFGTIFYNVNQFERNLYERIGEKIQSVRTEMEHKLGGDFELTSDDYDYLNYLLIKFSGVFNIDINLYDVEGNLLASSQSQIFEKGLMGNKMDTEAYKQLVANKKGKYIHRESIGGLSYYSAYVPFINDENRLLAYINLPYFTKQSELRKEIYTVVVAVVNIYFFLILISVIVAVFVSNNITKPLELIQERFRAIDLGKKNEPIAYTSHDEIGSLIKEYNRMVSELTENAEKLAKSERESAWREMAKQIAHEIKNPLTPMKLSVQYLQKAWKDNIPDFDKRLEKFSNSLISQINNLSSIATEFSNFAKMPRARAEEVDIVAKLNETINLFENTENVTFHTDFQDVKELFVYADKEQVLIVFSNLIQNGIQAVPKERNPEITIGLKVIKDHVKIRIRDNGKGIPDELKEKLFIPNFTTKSSGMGLGLAIVKNIVVNAGGEIWYETQLDKPDKNQEGGTTFYVTFPIYKTSE